MKRSEANAKFTHYADLPMLVLSVLFIAVLVIPILNEHLSFGWRHLFAIASIVLWAAFAAEYIIRLVLAPVRRHFIMHNILDLVVVAVPMLRPLRLARLARFARVGALAHRATSLPEDRC
jgi:voltage-gated potassium channel